MLADQKQAFLQHIYSELELRVGVKLSEGLSDDQMSEFEAFMDRDTERVEAWFAAHLPNYTEQQDYQRLQASAPEGVAALDILCEYGSLKWLELNRPDYRQVVADELANMKQEIAQNKDAILGSQQ
jgi:hypothetical protein